MGTVLLTAEKAYILNSWNIIKGPRRNLKTFLDSSTHVARCSAYSPHFAKSTFPSYTVLRELVIFAPASFFSAWHFRILLLPLSLTMRLQ